MKRVLVTGGAGFIGSHLVDALRARGDAVAVLDDLSSGAQENVAPDVPLYHVDVRCRADVASAFQRFAPTHLCHLAAQASVKRSVDAPDQDASVNVIGGLNVLDAARQCGVQRVVFASTGGAIYGEVPRGGRAREGWPLAPKSPYAAAKAALEHYLGVYQRCFGLPGTVLRFANVFGPRQDPAGEAGVVAIFLGRLAAGLPIQIFGRRRAGDAGYIRDYVFVADVVSALLMAVDGELEGTFNVGSGRGLGTRAVAEALARALGVAPEIEPAPPRAGDLERSVLDPSALVARGWRPQFSFEAGIAQTARCEPGVTQAA
ncbi:MAG: NAD-dependent epimerase/dehydratase family protein [Polyangiaceae bacterium]|nr:NAD-dependent epimerase/dehydratase family protein [Polyangiaceae bacterium]